MRRFAVILIAGLGGATVLGTAATATPERVPLPPPRPAELGASEEASARQPAEGQEPSRKQATSKPDSEGKPTPEPAQAGQDKADSKSSAQAPAPSGGPVAAAPEAVAEDASCRARIEKLGVRFESLPPIRSGACGAALPLRVTSLGDGLELSSPATVVCPVAEALALWARETAAPAAREHLGAALTALQIGTSYECRGQNRRAGAKLSEHAFANGVDIMGFKIKGRAPVPVEDHPDGSPEERFLDAVRAPACERFTTVLGPGSDAAHADHLHLDLRARRGGYRMCQ